MALESIIQFNTGPLLVRDDGALALVKLSSSTMAFRGFEYYYQPGELSYNPPAYCFLAWSFAMGSPTMCPHRLSESRAWRQVAMASEYMTNIQK